MTVKQEIVEPDSQPSDVPPSAENGEFMWDFADKERVFSEVHLAGTEMREEDGFVIKEILRTGEWPGIPTNLGVMPKPMRVVRDGASSQDEGVISLSELVENFKAGAIPAVQIPLSDDSYDHKNITKVNTGFIRDLWITEEGENAKLVAKMEFTEPEVKEKVLRGTYADVSCGIPWEITSRGKKWGAVLEHAAITNRPFIDGLGPFLAASDQAPSDAEVVHFGHAVELPVKDESAEEEVATEENTDTEAATEEQRVEGEISNKTSEPEKPELTAEQLREKVQVAVQDALVADLNLSKDYLVKDIAPEKAIVVNDVAKMTWEVPIQIDGEDVSVAAVKDWVSDETEGQQDEPSAEVSDPPHSEPLSELEQARRFRELRMDTPSTQNEEVNMTLTREELDRLEMSDQQRAALSEILNENADLRAQNREVEASHRVGELEELGLKEKPGALKLYREVMLSDDGGPAVVLLSDEGQEKERLTALEILDRFIEGIKGSEEKIVLSDQALVSGNDEKPPVDAGEESPFEERLADAKQAIGQK